MILSLSLGIGSSAVNIRQETLIQFPCQASKGTRQSCFCLLFSISKEEDEEKESTIHFFLYSFSFFKIYDENL